MVPGRGPLIRVGPKTPSPVCEEKKPALYLANLAHLIWQINVLRRSSFLYLAHQHISPFSTANSGVSHLYIAPLSFYGWIQELWKCENYISYLKRKIEDTMA